LLTRLHRHPNPSPAQKTEGGSIRPSPSPLHTLVFLAQRSSLVSLTTSCCLPSSLNLPNYSIALPLQNRPRVPLSPQQFFYSFFVGVSLFCRHNGVSFHAHCYHLLHLFSRRYLMPHFFGFRWCPPSNAGKGLLSRSPRLGRHCQPAASINFHGHSLRIPIDQMSGLTVQTRSGDHATRTFRPVNKFIHFDCRWYLFLSKRPC